MKLEHARKHVYMRTHTRTRMDPDDGYLSPEKERDLRDGVCTPEIRTIRCPATYDTISSWRGVSALPAAHDVHVESSPGSRCVPEPLSGSAAGESPRPRLHWLSPPSPRLAGGLSATAVVLRAGTLCVTPS